ncbi:uncharacterized protein B0H18DRAFT_1025296 [Fomitopsis serialis]|uniref:uncharacterized protein n=1 Tax=Fomitopsis serialis TaxID=139415 RepID=UPI0020076992|nr:uncharacterized protein B0H18DRAFT_1025296 [Neoantrodia serialis]KAH9920140.1 hypothetical protein B0H18DRAFT_1025296 [Neoantrodia serialis]
MTEGGSVTSQPPTADTPASQLDYLHGGLLPHEQYWHNRQPWLQERGYMLRPRYRTDWKPSWLGTDKYFGFCEDGRSTISPVIMDATKTSDGLHVTLKKVNTQVHPFEVEIGQFLSSEETTSNPRNYCARILDVLPDPTEPNTTVIAMPLLKAFYDPDFVTIGEAVAFFKQIIEGLHFMHKKHVAHRDISMLNVMMDATPMYPDLWHPQATVYKRDFSGRAKHFSRTERPPKYFYIDFGLSRKYNSDDGQPQELPILGGDKTVPEFQEQGYDKPANPFRTDIYYLGNLMRTQFLNKYRGLDFVQPLVADMVQNDPEKRPTIEEVESRFDGISCQLSWWQLRSRLVEKDENALVRTVFGIGHIFRTAKYVIKRRPPVPLPP